MKRNAECRATDNQDFQGETRRRRRYGGLWKMTSTVDDDDVDSTFIIRSSRRVATPKLEMMVVRGQSVYSNPD